MTTHFDVSSATITEAYLLIQAYDVRGTGNSNHHILINNTHLSDIDLPSGSRKNRWTWMESFPAGYYIREGIQ